MKTILYILAAALSGCFVIGLMSPMPANMFQYYLLAGLIMFLTPAGLCLWGANALGTREKAKDAERLSAATAKAVADALAAQDAARRL
jgi:hypothetical protein